MKEMHYQSGSGPATNSVISITQSVDVEDNAMTITDWRFDDATSMEYFNITLIGCIYAESTWKWLFHLTLFRGLKVTAILLISSPCIWAWVLCPGWVMNPNTCQTNEFRVELYCEELSIILPKRSS